MKYSQHICVHFIEDDKIRQNEHENLKQTRCKVMTNET